MLKDIKNTVKQSAIYGLSRVSSKLISFILLPLYSIYFSVAEYGIISRVESLWQILWSIFLFGLESGIIRWYLKIDNLEDKKKFLFSVSLFLLILNLFFTILFYTASDFFSTLIFKSNEYSTLIYYASLIATMEALTFVVFLILRINEKAFLYSFFSILIAVLSLLIQVYYIRYTELKLEGIFIAKIISPALFLIVSFPYYMKFMKVGFDVKNIRNLIIFSFPIMLSSLMGTLLNQSDRFLLGYFSSSVVVGWYSLAYNICGLLNFFIISPFSLAFTVISWKKLNDSNALRFFTKNITYLFFAVTFLALILALVTPYLIKIFTLNKDYWYAGEVVPWIAIAMPFYGISSIGFFSFYVSKKTYYILYFTATALVVNLLLNLLLIPFFKMYGAAVSNFVSFFLICYLNYRFSKKNYFFKYEWKKIFLMLVVYTIFTFPFFYFNMNDFTVGNLILKLLAIILFPVVLYFLKFYEPIEIERFKNFLNKYLNFKRRIYR